MNSPKIGFVTCVHPYYDLPAVVEHRDRAVAELTELVVDAYRRFRLTVVMVTHQLDHLPPVANRIIMVKNARVTFSGDRAALDDARLLAELFADAA